MMTAIFDLNVPFVSTKPTTNLFIRHHTTVATTKQHSRNLAKITLQDYNFVGSG